MRRREIDPERDLDLQAALERGGESTLAQALAAVCRCGHARSDHAAATGALGSFGASACDHCWTCGTFTPNDPEQATHLAATLELAHRRKRCLRAVLPDGQHMVLDDYLFGTPEGQLIEFRADVDDAESRIVGIGIVAGYDAGVDAWRVRDETPVEVAHRITKLTAGLL